MAIKILEATEYADRNHFLCHIDDSKVDDEGNPLPEYCMEFNWGKDVDLSAARREMRLLCEQRLAELNTAPIEGVGDTL